MSYQGNGKKRWYHINWIQQLDLVLYGAIVGEVLIACGIAMLWWVPNVGKWVATAGLVVHLGSLAISALDLE
jgi:hypothetical protein